MLNMDSLIASVSSLTLNKAIKPAPKPKSKRRRRTNRQSQAKQATMISFPEHHDKIAEQLPFVSWQEDIIGNDHILDYDSNIMGSFTCSNNNCSKKGWRSNVVAITIRMYANNKYDAVVYRQRCKSCSRLGNMSIDIDSYVERVVFRIKRWSGIPVETPAYSDGSKGPHESSLCEGCKAGHCPRRVD